MFRLGVATAFIWGALITLVLSWATPTVCLVMGIICLFTPGKFPAAMVWWALAGIAFVVLQGLGGVFDEVAKALAAPYRKNQRYV